MSPDDPIDLALRRVYGGQEPFFYGAQILFADGGPDPLDAVAIYQVAGARPHFHYVSYGLAVAGFELTFRLGADPAQLASEPGPLGALAHRAPTWPIGMLNMLARRVHRTRRAFGEGHWWEGAPGVLRPHTEKRHLVFARDPALGVVEVGGRSITFLQATLVGPETIESIKADELARRAADPSLVSYA
jgi:hypothetical protein